MRPPEVRKRKLFSRKTQSSPIAKSFATKKVQLDVRNTQLNTFFKKSKPAPFSTKWVDNRELCNMSELKFNLLWHVKKGKENKLKNNSSDRRPFAATLRNDKKMNLEENHFSSFPKTFSKNMLPRFELKQRLYNLCVQYFIAHGKCHFGFIFECSDKSFPRSQ